MAALAAFTTACCSDLPKGALHDSVPAWLSFIAPVVQGRSAGAGRTRGRAWRRLVLPAAAAQPAPRPRAGHAPDQPASATGHEPATRPGRGGVFTGRVLRHMPGRNVALQGGTAEPGGARRPRPGHASGRTHHVELAGTFRVPA